MQGRLDQNKRGSNASGSIWVVVFLCLGVSLVVYSPFVFGDYWYVYADIAADTLAQFLPGYTSISRYITAGSFPLWSFEHGLGQNIFTATPDSAIDPFNFLLMISPFGIERSLVYIQILKILLTGALHHCFLKKLGLSDFTCVIIPVLYAFNGDIIVRGGWYHHAIDSFLFALLFLAIEYALQDNNFKILPIAGLAVVILRTIYYPYLYGLLCVGYAAIRYLFIREFKSKPFFQYVLKISCFFLLGYVIGAFYFIPSMYSAFTAARPIDMEGNLLQLLLSMSDRKALLSAFLSLFSPAMQGIGLSYKGYLNILEAPVIYCGLLSLFLIPVTIMEHKGKQRKLFVFLFLLCLCYMLFPIVHKVFNGPTELYYKTSSFIIPVILLFISAYGVDSFIKHKHTHSVLLSLSFLLLFYILCLFDYYSQAFRISYIVAIGTLVFFVLYLFSGHAYPKPNSSGLQILLLCLVLVEASIWNYQIVSGVQRMKLSKDSEIQRIHYWDGTIDAVNYVKMQEPVTNPNFYRIQKTYKSVSNNDSQYQSYFGTNIYDSFVKKDLYDFFALVQSTSDIHRTTILVPHESDDLNSFLSVKYLLDNANTAHIPDNYTYLHSIGDVKIYENKKAFPFGFLYENAILTEQFEELEPENRMRVLYHTAIVNSDDLYNLEEYEKMDFPPEIIPIRSFRPENTAMKTSVGKTWVVTPQSENAYLYFPIDGEYAETLLFHFNVHSSNEEDLKIYWSTVDNRYFNDDNVLLVNMPAESGIVSTVVPSDNVTGLLVSLPPNDAQYYFRDFGLKCDGVNVDITEIRFADVLINTPSISYTSSTDDPYIIISPSLPYEQATQYKTTLSFLGVSDAFDTCQVFYRKEGEPFSEEKSVSCVIYPKSRHYTIDLDQPYDELRLDFGQKAGQNYSVSQISISHQSEEEYQYWDNAAQRAWDNRFQIESFTETEISGTITAKQNSLLFFTIPYDGGWNAVVDGNRVDTVKANIGFIGIPMAPGEHEVKLYFIPYGLKTGLIVSGVGVAAYVLLCFRPRLKNKGPARKRK